MAQDNIAQERTEAATPRRRQKVREEGNVAKSIDLNSSLVLLTSALALYFGGTWILDGMSELIRDTFAHTHQVHLDMNSLKIILRDGSKRLAVMIAPLMISVAIVGLVANLAQVGFVASLKPITPKSSKLNPLTGFKRMISMKSVATLIKNLLKLFVIGLIAYVSVKDTMALYSVKLPVNEWELVVSIGRLGFSLLLKIALVLVVLGVFDYLYQRYEFEKSIRMSRTEVKQDAKEVEGDPTIKSRIRSIQIETAKKRMMKEVPDADVVIVNPVHLAVALRYEVEAMAAPRVVAKGARLIAERIKQIAEAAGVPIVENEALAQTLYHSTEIGMEIPENLFRATAEILAYVYKLKGKRVFYA